MLKHLKLKWEIKMKSNRLISFPIDDEKSLQNYLALFTKIEDLKKY